MPVSPLKWGKSDVAEVPVPLEANVPAAVQVDVTDEVPEGGYGWVCVLGVG